MPELVGAIVPRRRGGFVAAMQGGFKSVDLATGKVSLIAAPEADRPGNRFNDGKCDRRGRFWAGTLALDTTPSAGSLYRLDPDGRVTVMETGFHVSNGLGWSPDDKRFYFTDSGRRHIYVYDFDANSGRIENKRDLRGSAGGLRHTRRNDRRCGRIRLERALGRMVRDALRPEGRRRPRHQLPVPRPTSCMFGGPDLGTLFVTSARIRLSAAQLAESPLSGSVFAIDTGVRGLPEPAFAG